MAVAALSVSLDDEPSAAEGGASSVNPKVCRRTLVALSKASGGMSVPRRGSSSPSDSSSLKGTGRGGVAVPKSSHGLWPLREACSGDQLRGSRAADVVA